MERRNKVRLYVYEQSLECDIEEAMDAWGSKLYIGSFVAYQLNDYVIQAIVYVLAKDHLKILHFNDGGESFPQLATYGSVVEISRDKVENIKFYEEVENKLLMGRKMKLI